MAMLTAAGAAAIQNALEEELADYAKKKAKLTFLSTDEANEDNVALVLKLKTRIMTDIDAAWSD